MGCPGEISISELPSVLQSATQICSKQTASLAQLRRNPFVVSSLLMLSKRTILPSIMSNPAFVVTVPTTRALFRKSAILGPSVASRVSVAPGRCAYFPIRACIPSDQPTQVPAADESATAVPETPAEDTPPDDVVTHDAAEENVTAETATEDVVAQVENPVSEKGEEAPLQDSKVEGQRRRRRRSRKREVTLPLEQMTIGMELEGTVKSVTDYGAFVGDMGTPTDGLMHVSQLAAGFVEKVTDVVNVGDKIKVRVLNIDVEKGNFSLTRKTPEELEADSQPRVFRKDAARGAAAAKREELNRRWDDFTFDPEAFIDAKVISVTDFGAFCRLVDENGEPLESSPTDGLIHISELSKERVAKVSDVLTEGQAVKVRITSTDRKRNRISMSLRPVGEDSSSGNSSAALAEDMANAEKNQPTFKTLFELAFETAKTETSEK